MNCQALFVFEKYKKVQLYLKVLSAVAVISALRVTSKTTNP